MYVRVLPQSLLELIIPNADEASQSDPDELSFRKGDILLVPSTMGKWWEARDSKGAVGSTFSLYSSAPY